MCTCQFAVRLAQFTILDFVMVFIIDLQLCYQLYWMTFEQLLVLLNELLVAVVFAAFAVHLSLYTAVSLPPSLVSSAASSTPY